MERLVHPRLDRFSATYAAAVETRRGRQFEYRLRRADGQYRWVLSAGTPRYTTDGVLTGSIGILTDITDVKRNQERMLASQKLESLGVLASGVAHDFNNLLGCILADADLAIMELDAGSPAREGLERIETVAIRASEIVRQMMAYAGQEKKDFESTDIAGWSTRCSIFCAYPFPRMAPCASIFRAICRRAGQLRPDPAGRDEPDPERGGGAGRTGWDHQHQRSAH